MTRTNKEAVNPAPEPSPPPQTARPTGAPRADFRKTLHYHIGKNAVAGFQRLPIGMAFRLGRGVGRMCHRVLPGRRRIVRRNANILSAWATSNGKTVGPSDAVADPEAMTREIFLRSGANLFAGLTSCRMLQDEYETHFHLTGLPHLQAALAENRGVIVLLAHMGPWEALTHLPTSFIKAGIHTGFGTLYRPLNNPRMDEWINRLRARHGCRLFSRRDGFHKPVDFLRGGGILGILADQKMREGVTVDYFGQPAQTSPIPGLFHRRSGAPMVALSLATVGFARWEMRFHPVDLSGLPPKPGRETLARAANQALETALSTSLCDGFWFQRRFAASNSPLDVSTP